MSAADWSFGPSLFGRPLLGLFASGTGGRSFSLSAAPAPPQSPPAPPRCVPVAPSSSSRIPRRPPPPPPRTRDVSCPTRFRSSASDPRLDRTRPAPALSPFSFFPPPRHGPAPNPAARATDVSRDGRRAAHRSHRSAARAADISRDGSRAKRGRPRGWTLTRAPRVRRVRKRRPGRLRHGVVVIRHTRGDAPGDDAERIGVRIRVRVVPPADDLRHLLRIRGGHPRGPRPAAGSSLGWKNPRARVLERTRARGRRERVRMRRRGGINVPGQTAVAEGGGVEPGGGAACAFGAVGIAPRRVDPDPGPDPGARAPDEGAPPGAGRPARARRRRGYRWCC